MSIIRRDERGQISVEYLLLFVVILAAFGYIIVNFIGPTIDASNNVTAVSDTKIVVSSIADAVNIVYANGPGSKRTVNINVPRDMSINFDTTNHLVGVTVNNLNYNGNSSNSKFINNSLDYRGAITSPVSLTKGWRTVQVYWNNSITPSRMEITQLP